MQIGLHLAVVLLVVLEVVVLEVVGFEVVAIVVVVLRQLDILPKIKKKEIF